MKTEKIEVQNLKCGGCAATITDKLKSLVGVEEVQVDIDHDVVNITYNENAALRKEISSALSDIGYPETGKKNNLFKKAQSYVSCAIGRMKS